MWVQLLPIMLPGRQEDVSMRLHYTHQEAAVAAQGERSREGAGAGGSRRGRGPPQARASELRWSLKTPQTP
eukprot:826140-Pelagomonas_calceolata.AAC.6